MNNGMDKENGKEQRTTRKAEEDGRCGVSGGGEREVSRGKENEKSGGMASGKHVEAARGDGVEKAGEMEKSRSGGAEREKPRGGAQVADMREDGREQRAGEEESSGKTHTETHKMDKELVVMVEMEGEAEVSLIELLKAVELACGRVVGCRVRETRKWEIMMSSTRGKEKLLDGFKLKGARVTATELSRDIKVVSFLNLPVYITDEQIDSKLRGWGVSRITDIRRKKWLGTEVYDGTRYMKVKFPEGISSLPYSTKFETLEGAEFFRVIHDRQLKLCRFCLMPGHIVRECPDFKCHKCGKQGHYMRECPEKEERRRGAEREMEEEESSGEEGDEAGVSESGGAEEEEAEERVQVVRESIVEETVSEEDLFQERRAKTGREKEARGGRRSSGRSRSPRESGVNRGEELPCGQTEVRSVTEVKEGGNVKKGTEKNKLRFGWRPDRGK